LKLTENGGINMKFNVKTVIISIAILAVMVAGYLFVESRNAYAAGDNLNNSSNLGSSDFKNMAVINGDIQEVGFKLTSNGYEPIVVQKGIPVKFNIRADQSNINSCNGTIVIPEYNAQIDLKSGDNIIEFTPTESGTIGYSCWMGMINSSIIVVDDLSNIDQGAIAIPNSGSKIGMPCCNLKN
jgi:hypothetical protein